MLEKLPKFTKDNYSAIILFCILILAIFLRFKGLIFQSYWFDELFTAYVSNPTNSLSTVISKTLSDVHPPLYQALLWGWYHIFGYSDWSGRSFSAIFGILGVLSMYFMAKEFYNKEVGLYASAITSVNYFLIYFSQETRSYMFIFLLTTLSYMYFFRLIKKYTITSIILYLLSTIALIYTHYFSFFLIFTQFIGFLYILFSQKNRRQELFKICIIITIALGISILPLVESILTLSHQGATWMKTPDSLFFIDYMKSYVLSPFLHKIFLFLLILSIITLIIKHTSSMTKTATLILIIWIIIGYLIPYIRSVYSVPLLSPKNTIILVPAFITLISFGIYKLHYVWLKLLIIAAIIFFSLYHLYRMEYYTTATKDQFRTILYKVSQESKKLPIYDIIMYSPTFQSYYFKTQAKLSKINVVISNNINLPLQYNKTQSSCFWVLQAHKNYIQKKKLLQKDGLHILKKIDAFQAQALLYGYKKTLNECIK